MVIRRVLLPVGPAGAGGLRRAGAGWGGGVVARWMAQTHQGGKAHPINACEASELQTTTTDSIIWQPSGMASVAVGER